MIALIPARAGSKRIPGKNTKVLAGHPLIAYTIGPALQSGVFTCVIVCSDDPEAIAISEQYGAMTYRRQPVEDAQPDIVWVKHFLADTKDARDESFAILRPTSPFRSAATIQRAYKQFQATQDTKDSLRAVEPVTQHPYKCWRIQDEMKPVFPGSHPDGTPFHSSPTQSLPAILWQNSSLEMAWTWVVERLHTISGRKVAPFLTHGHEGFALDTADDWSYAEYLVATGRATLPVVASAPAAALPPVPAA